MRLSGPEGDLGATIQVYPTYFSSGVSLARIEKRSVGQTRTPTVR